jgi:hypothetical protein
MICLTASSHEGYGSDVSYERLIARLDPTAGVLKVAQPVLRV